MNAIDALRRRLAQIRCWSVGHMPVTKRGGGEVYEACFICDRRIGTGWNFQGLATPRRRLTKIATQFAEWQRKHAS